MSTALYFVLKYFSSLLQSNSLTATFVYNDMIYSVTSVTLQASSTPVH
jgi:hypothetical protein